MFETDFEALVAQVKAANPGRGKNLERLRALSPEELVEDCPNSRI